MSTSVSDTQKQLEILDPSDDKYRSLLHELLSNRDLKPYVQGLHGPDLEGFIELLDRVLGHTPVTDDLFRKTLLRLQSICSNREVLPRSYIIQGKGLSKKGQAIASGDFADVHEAELYGKKVCVKTLRLYIQDTGGVTKKIFYREVVLWKRLQHPNIVPFLGVPAEIPPFEIVCGWMENGSITEYVRKKPDVDRVNLLWDVAEGLDYLHSCNVIHGGLKGANVLVDEYGHARLADFGLASIIRGEVSVVSPQEPHVTSTTTWAAPEILRGDPVSKEGDVFTFAMIAVEIFTGHPPFVGNYQAAIFDIMSGKRPDRPETLDHEGLWDIMKRCWSQEPEGRPTTSQLLEFFRESFPRGRDIPKTQPLPSAPSTWTLADSEGYTNRDTDILPGSSRRDTVDKDEPRPQYPPDPPPMPTIGAKVYSHTTPTGSLLRTPFSQTEQRLPIGDGQRVPDPCVDGPPNNPVFTKGPPILANNHTASPSLLRQLRNVCLALPAAVRSMIQGNRERDGRIPSQQPGHASSTEVKRNPLRARQSRCCCCCPCF